jgi:N-acetylmuramoyl-L-alanine amidase/Stage II sporulation protein
MILANKMKFFLSFSIWALFLLCISSGIRYQYIYDSPIYESNISWLLSEKVYRETASTSVGNEMTVDHYKIKGKLSFDTPRTTFYFQFPRPMGDIREDDIIVEWTASWETAERSLDVEDMDMRGYESSIYSTPLVTGIRSEIEFRIISKNPIEESTIKLISSDNLTARKELTFDMAREIRADGMIVSRADWWANEEFRYKDSTYWKPYFEKLQNQPIKIPTATEIEAAALAQARELYLVNQSPDTTKYVTRIRNEGGRPLVWPIEKTKQVNRIIIHHTAESMDKQADDETLIRAIYQYHTLSRGWGDIGYNYVIWQRGKIYEGRAGWSYVIGAHAQWNNAGTVWISVIGNYETLHLNRDQKAWIEQAITYFAEKYGIDLTKSVSGVKVCKTGECTLFVDVTTSSLIWHRDVWYTSCPGANIYSEIPGWISSLTRSYTLVDNPIVWPIEYATENTSSTTPVSSTPTNIAPIWKKILPPKSRFPLGPTIDIRLSYPTTNTSIHLTSGTKKNVFLVFDKKRILLRSTDIVSITSLGSSLEATVGTKKYTASTFSLQWDLVEISSWSRIPSWDTARRYNDNLFRGKITISLDEGKLLVVNSLPIEYYLKGMGEVSEWDAKAVPEKAKTIIVWARSYGRYYLDPSLPNDKRKFPWKPFDISDNPDESQKYLGYSYELRSPSVSKLVDETNREVVTYDNKIVKVWYSSSTDGKTRSAKEYCLSNGGANCEDIPYLQSVDDPGAIGKTRNGHGVGISWVGSAYFALQGWDYKKIIEYYLKGVKVAKK